MPSVSCPSFMYPVLLDSQHFSPPPPVFLGSQAGRVLDDASRVHPTSYLEAPPARKESTADIDRPIDGPSVCWLQERICLILKLAYKNLRTSARRLRQLDPIFPYHQRHDRTPVPRFSLGLFLSPYRNSYKPRAPPDSLLGALYSYGVLWVREHRPHP